jgi:hypothetical protein
MVNLTYLVHVGCHLDRRVVEQAGAYAMSGADLVGDNGKASADGKGGWEGRTGANMYRDQRCLS